MSLWCIWKKKHPANKLIIITLNPRSLYWHKNSTCNANARTHAHTPLSGPGPDPGLAGGMNFLFYCSLNFILKTTKKTKQKKTKN
jgi:hypothetical protein